MEKNTETKIKKIALVLVMVVMFSLLYSNFQWQNYTPFTIFNFENETFTPSMGTGSITLIGGTTHIWGVGINCYNGGVLVDPHGIALSVSDFPAQHTNPETAGIQINTPTTGHNQIGISWDQSTFNTAANRIRLKYTIDGTTWIDFNANSDNAINHIYDSMPPNFLPFDDGLFVVPGLFQSGAFTHRKANFINIPGAGNNPNFAFRLVTAFPSGRNNYSNHSTYSPTGVILFDNIRVWRSNAPIVAPPMFHPFGGIFDDSVVVTLTSTIDGASIVYTTNGTVPSVTNGIVYTEPINITSTTQIRARIINDGANVSSIVSHRYIIPTVVSSISEMISEGAGHFTIMSEVTITHVYHSTWFVAQDHTGATEILRSAGWNANVGDTFVGLRGSRTPWGNSLTLSNPSITPISTGNNITPVVLTIAELLNDLPTLCMKLITLKNVHFLNPGGVFILQSENHPISDGTGTTMFRARFNTDLIGQPIPTELVDITGFHTGTGTVHLYMMERSSSDIVLSSGGPLNVILSSFSARANNVGMMSSSPVVNIEWTTSSETNLRGFSLHRKDVSATQNVGNVIDVNDAVIINSSLIPATNTSVSSTYRFTDNQICGDTIDFVCTSFYYWLEVIGNDGTSTLHGPIPVRIDSSEIAELPTFTSISSVFPNPLRLGNIANFDIDVKEYETATLQIFNIRGQLVHEVSDIQPGAHRIEWDGRDTNNREIASGVYFYRLSSPSTQIVRRMVVIK